MNVVKPGDGGCSSWVYAGRPLSEAREGGNKAESTQGRVFWTEGPTSANGLGPRESVHSEP